MSGEATQEDPSRLRARYGLPLLIAGLSVTTVAGCVLFRRDGAYIGGTVPVWAMVVAFALADMLSVDIPTRRERHSVSLSDFPLVVALFVLTPLWTVAAQLLGTGVMVVLRDRQRGIKLVYNVVQVSFTAIVAVAVFRSLLDLMGTSRAAMWIAAGAAAFVTEVLSHSVLTAAMWLHSGTFQRDLAIWTLVTSLVALIAKASLALLGVIVLEQHVTGAVLLLFLIVAVMFAAFSAYAGLYLRHQRVEKLYQFTRAISGSVEATEISERAVREARDLLHAEASELVLHGSVELAVSYDAAGRVNVGRFGLVDAAVIEALSDVHSVAILTRETAESPLAAWLARRGWDQALLAPLGTDVNVGWLAVSRSDDDQPFVTSDAQLFEALANHASVALENGRLLDELSAAARQREHRSLHDELTDLANRVHLSDALAAAIQHADDNERVALLIVGVEDLGEIKETLGHEHGDEVVLQMASRLRDVAQGDWLVARLSEDEFAILVPDAGAIGAAVRTADIVVRAFEEQPFSVAGLVLEVGVRVGVAVHPDHGSTATLIMRRAEIALRAAKGKHARVGAFLPGDDPHTPQQLVVAHELRKAIEDGELAVYVQPKLDLATGTVHAVEALVRWIHDGVVRPPDQFIPVAERTGLIRPLTSFVLNRALEHRKQWAAAGYDINIAVNVSVRDLVDPAFPEQVAVALTRAVCPAHALTLEITETQIMVEPDRVAAALRRLGVLGVRLSIDDFGTGYSSLSAVRALAVNEVKVDRSFVQHSAVNEQDGTLVRSITELGHGLGLRVVAEGVEDDATLELLRSMGVDAAQGYGIARPMPALELPGWLAESDERALHQVPPSDAR